MDYIGIGLAILAGIGIGYALATRECLTAISDVQNWLESTNSNRWVASYMYEELEEKYDNLSKEYNQYQGAIKAFKDCKKIDIKE